MKHKSTQRANERSHERGPALGNVLIVYPGALENGGGIGRQMGYFLRARDAHDINLRNQVVDSRGSWFLGSSRIHSCLAAGYLADAVLKLIAARIGQSPCIAHINITGRGSTIRKIIIAAVPRVIGLRYLLHVHDADYGNEYCGRGRLMKYAIRKTFHGAEKILVLGGRDRQLLLQLMELASERVSILRNAVPDPQPDHPTRRAAAKPCHLLFLGYLSERKGVPELLMALASPKVASLNWCASLAGGGPVDNYRRFAMDLGIAGRIEFPGSLDQIDVGALCGDAEVLVLPSHAEGLAMSVLEGLSYGLAVITTPIGTHTEVVEPDISGILVAPSDVEGLADALARVISDEHLRSPLQAGAQRRFLEGFDVRVNARRLVHEHANLLSRQPGVEVAGKGTPYN